MHIIHSDIGAPQIEVKNLGANHALFVVSPLPTGYGMTLGNAFRRVLLSSLPGAAVTAVKVKGASHEYTTLAGVQDSVLDILLNLKRLQVKKHGSAPTTLKLEVKSGSGEVTAAEIEKNADIEILNPKHVIARLDKKASLNLEITIEKGVGYLPAAERQAKNKEVGLIYLDATFSPVVRVRYDVAAARVGSLTNLDKLEMEVLTNGSMQPDEAVKFASNLLQNYFGMFNAEAMTVEADFVARPAVSMVSAPVAAPAVEDVTESVALGESVSDEKYTPVEILGFSPRTLNALINGGIGSVEQLTKCTPSRIEALRGCGHKALDEITAKLSERGLTLTEE